MNTEQSTGELITPAQAADILGLTRQSVYQLIRRKHLHSFPDPNSRGRSLLSRSEVEARARLAQRFPRGVRIDSIDTRREVFTGGESTPGLTRQELTLIAAGGLTLGTMVLLIQRESDPVLKALAIGALVALGVLLLAELQKEGKIDAIERRKLEQLAESADTNPMPFVDALARLGVPGVDTSASA